MQRQIKKDDLVDLFKRIIEKLQYEGAHSVDLDSDLYLFIPTNKWDSYEDNVLQGSLFDDWDSLKKNLEETDERLSFVDFDRVASILRFISEKMNPVDG